MYIETKIIMQGLVYATRSDGPHQQVKTSRSIYTFILSSLENVTIPRTAPGGRSRFITLVVDPVSGVEIAETVAVAKAAAGKRMERNEIIFV